MFKRTSAIATISVALAVSALAQVRGTAVPPPVISQTVEVQRGGKVTIPLGIHGGRGEVLEFLIRTPPSRGKLSAVRSTAMNSAIVTYTPSAGKSSEDRFTYAVRGSEGVSAPGWIIIRIVDPVIAPAKLKAPGEVEFPAVFIGERSTAEFEIANEGGGFLEGEVAVSEPWSVDGLKIFKVAGGQRTMVRLVFTPKQPGTRTGEAVISGTGRKIVLLRATAEDRLAVATPHLKLAAQPGNQTRMGVLKIVNRSAEDANVTIETGAQVMTDRAVKVPARGEATVPVFADAASGAAFDETLKLSSGEWSASVPVRAPAIGAILKFARNEVVITGTAKAREAAGNATLENSGGEAVTVRLDVEPPFDLHSRVVTAPARGSVEIPVAVSFAGPGKFQATLKATGDAASALISVKAEISDDAEPSKPAVTKRTEAIAEEPTKKQAIPEASKEDPQYPMDAREIPNFLGRFAKGTGIHTATIDWPASLGHSGNVHIEQRTLALNAAGDDLQVHWSPLSDTTITHEGDRMRAELRELKPGTLYTVRVVEGSGPDAGVLFTADFWTVAKPPFFTASMCTGLLAVVLVALLFAIWRARNPRVRQG